MKGGFVRRAWCRLMHVPRRCCLAYGDGSGWVCWCGQRFADKYDAGLERRPKPLSRAGLARLQREAVKRDVAAEAEAAMWEGRR